MVHISVVRGRWHGSGLDHKRIAYHRLPPHAINSLAPINIPDKKRDYTALKTPSNENTKSIDAPPTQPWSWMNPHLPCPSYAPKQKTQPHQKRPTSTNNGIARAVSLLRLRVCHGGKEAQAQVALASAKAWTGTKAWKGPPNRSPKPAACSVRFRPDDPRSARRHSGCSATKVI